MKKAKFAPGNPSTGLKGSGNTSSGLFKKQSFGGFMPRTEGQAGRPNPSDAGGGSGGSDGKFGKPRGDGQGQRPTCKK